MDIEIICSFASLDLENEKFVIDLERSEYVKYRKQHLRELKIPMLRQVEKNLGPKVAPVVYETCPKEQKIELGLLPPLDGAGDTLWTSPSDLLIGKVCLKPPLTSKYLKALTHQGILEIGEHIERKYWNEMEIEKEAALLRQKNELLVCFETELKKSLVCLGVKFHEQCVAKIRQLTMQFELQLIDMLSVQEALMRVEFSYRLQEIKEVVRYHEVICEQAMQSAVAQTVQAMSKLFLEDLEKQQEILCEYFGNVLKNLEIQKNYESELMMLHAKQMLEQMTHSLECRNIAFMMYILCMERKKCQVEKCSIEKYYEQQMLDVEGKLKKQSDNVAKLKEALKIKSEEVKLREKCIVRILTEFQKFINYALKASPTQAEFLLSIEKMMVFELAESLKEVEVKPKPTGPLLKKFLKGKLLEQDVDDLIARDYHSCLKERNVKIDYASKHFHLPAFYYKKLLYVREDFRDMIQAGVVINSEHELWSPEVDILVEKLREVAKAAPKKQEKQQQEEQEKPMAKKSTLRRQSKKMDKPQDVTIQLSTEAIVKPGKSEIITTISSEEIECGKKFKPPPCKVGISTVGDIRDVTDTVDYQKIGEEEKKPTLLATTDSKQIYKKNLPHLYTGPSETESSRSVCLDLVDSTDQINIVDYLKWIGEVPEGVKSIDTTTDYQHHVQAFNEVESTVTSKRIDKLRPRAVSKVGIFLRSESKLAVATKDSIIGQKVAQQKISSVDVIGKPTHRESDILSVFQLKPKRSRLLETKNSAELYRKSVSSNLGKVCVKCPCHKELKKTVSSVSFFHKEEVIQLDSLEKIYKQDIAPQRKPKAKIVKKKVCKKVKPKCAVVGDKKAKEDVQESEEFTKDRITSFINMIKDYPDLIHMFTTVAK